VKKKETDAPPKKSKTMRVFFESPPDHLFCWRWNLDALIHVRVSKKARAYAKSWRWLQAGAYHLNWTMVKPN
jgi:hypothetical protein